ncbi:MAG: D-alanyl-D-alanine carboxypeptidase [Treponema sp.]|nr:D-alanyl-D-alanine carboxypeptidase [Treponema sp.]
MRKILTKKQLIILISSVLFILIASFTSLVIVRQNNFNKIENSTELTEIEQNELNNIKQSKYKTRNEILSELPYNLKKTTLDISAESAILIDQNTGNILYEKNADEIIPPASMTKLFVMYVVDEEISANRFSYNQIIPLPEESLACNMPPDSSLMFLGEGQIVTLEELILGLSICSGNDATYALAYTISGSMEAFIERMNTTAQNLELINTHFVESSGYSELNQTTAREMATFARIYLQKHPDSLQRFHSVRSFTYPKEQNMAEGDVYQAQDWSNGFPRHITMGITQKNTNPLLGKLEGCDGIKT